MVYQEHRAVKTQRDGVTDITGQVANIIRASGLKNGIVTVEADPISVGVLRLPVDNSALCEDVVREMRRLVPARINFTQEVSPEYTAGNLKCAFFGSTATGLIQKGTLLNGQSGFFLMEYDGPASRTYHVCVIGE